MEFEKTTIVENIKKTIQEVFEDKKIKIKEIILFGSRARGDHKKDSDWDLLVVTEDNLQRKQKLEIAHLIRKRLAEQFIPCDVLIKSQAELEERKNTIGSLIKFALKEGIPL